MDSELVFFGGPLDGQSIHAPWYEEEAKDGKFRALDPQSQIHSLIVRLGDGSTEHVYEVTEEDNGVDVLKHRGCKPDRGSEGKTAGHR